MFLRVALLGSRVSHLFVLLYNVPVSQSVITEVQKLKTVPGRILFPRFPFLSGSHPVFCLVWKPDISNCRFSVATKQALSRFLAPLCHRGVVATTRNEIKQQQEQKNSSQEQTHSLSPSWQVRRWTLKLHPCLVGPWVAEKKSCPQGYVCSLKQRWSSISNVCLLPCWALFTP